MPHAETGTRTSGEPVVVSVCHGFDCQRRTGWAFDVTLEHIA